MAKAAKLKGEQDDEQPIPQDGEKRAARGQEKQPGKQAEGPEKHSNGDETSKGRQPAGRRDQYTGAMTFPSVYDKVPKGVRTSDIPGRRRLDKKGGQ